MIQLFYGRQLYFYQKYHVNAAICLISRLRNDTLKAAGGQSGIDKYGNVSGIVEIIGKDIG